MLRRMHDYLRAHADDLRADLRALVEIESPSDDPDALRTAAEYLSDWAKHLTGLSVETIDDPAGPHLLLRSAGQGDPILLLGHFDTVWPLGTLRERPYVERDGFATGPGVFDMKAGVVQAMWGIAALRETAGQLPNLLVLLNSDEEMVSHRSRALIEDLARDASAALVAEPSLDGAVKTARKGVGRFHLTVHGQEAHAGVDPTKGSSAIGELARLVLALHALTDLGAGTTVNVGVVTGGTRPNVIAGRAEARVDVRATGAAETERVERAIRGLTSSGEGLRIEVDGGFARPPMERTAGIAALYERAKRVAAPLGIELAETATGGGSDANFCAALGIPVLDGLGAVGAGAHAADEFVRVDEMPARSALLAGLIADLGAIH